MYSDHLIAAKFKFKEDRHTGVFVCSHVVAGAPVLFVSHDDNGDWQFLCGGVHDEERGETPVLSCLECVVARDPTLNKLAGLCINHRAERALAGGAWKIYDEAESFIPSAIQRHGWAVQLVAPGGRREPGFAYTVGLFKSWKHAELIMFGLPNDVMHAALNDIGLRVRNGGRLVPGESLKDVLDGHDVRVREVTRSRSYRRHVGYALWYYDGTSFPLFQIVWPDKNGRFPGDRDAAKFLEELQPLLP